MAKDKDEESEFSLSNSGGNESESEEASSGSEGSEESIMNEKEDDIDDIILEEGPKYEYDDVLPTAFNSIEASVIQLCNLDRILLKKQTRKQEFYPLANARFLNISNASCPDYIQQGGNEEYWQDTEKDALLNYLLNDGYYSKDQYEFVKEQLDLSGVPPVLSLPALRELSPDNTFLFAQSLYRLFCFFGIIKAPLEEATESYVGNGGESYVNGSCNSCGSQLSINANYSCKKILLEICTACFELGIFPAVLSSIDFERKSMFCQELEKVQCSWSDEETYQLLRSVASAMEWSAISEKLGKPVSECIFVFLTLDCNRNDKAALDAPDMLRKLIGITSNPLMSITSLVSKAVHPGLGSIIAKSALTALSNDTTDSFESLAAEGLKEAIKRAGDMASSELEIQNKCLSELIKLEMEVLEKKLFLAASDLTFPK